MDYYTIPCLVLAAIALTVLRPAWGAAYILRLIAPQLRACQRLPPAWYLMAFLTLAPIVKPIPRDAAVPFLAAYCLAALWVGRTRKRPTARPALADAPFFMGVRITVG